MTDSTIPARRFPAVRYRRLAIRQRRHPDDAYSLDLWDASLQRLPDRRNWNFRAAWVEDRLRTSFVGRYQSELSSLSAIDFNPTIAYRVLPWLSVGGGFTAEYVALELKQAIDFGSACVVALGAMPCGPVFRCNRDRATVKQRSSATISRMATISAS